MSIYILDNQTPVLSDLTITNLHDYMITKLLSIIPAKHLRQVYQKYFQ